MTPAPFLFGQPSSGAGRKTASADARGRHGALLPLAARRVHLSFYISVRAALGAAGVASRLWARADPKTKHYANNPLLPIRKTSTRQPPRGWRARAWGCGAGPPGGKRQSRGERISLGTFWPPAPREKPRRRAGGAGAKGPRPALPRLPARGAPSLRDLPPRPRRRRPAAPRQPSGIGALGGCRGGRAPRVARALRALDLCGVGGAGKSTPSAVYNRASGGRGAGERPPPSLPAAK